MLKAVIMDFDGVIVDTEVVWYEIYRDWFEKNRNYQLSVKEFLSCVGSQEEDLFRELERQRGVVVDRKKFKDDVLQSFMERSSQLPPREGVAEFIQEVRSEGLKLALATSATRQKPISHLKRLRLIEYFDAIVTAEDVKRIKPFPDLFQEAARQLAVMPQEVLIVEDSANGMKAGIRAQMRVLIVPNEVTKISDFQGGYQQVNSLSDVHVSDIMEEFTEGSFMLLKKVTASDVMIKVQTENWEDAIRKSARILLEKGSIEARYIDAMIQVVHDNGPYIVIGKHIALAHARTECGALHTDISFATLSPATNFGAGDLDPVKLVITLSATNPETHLDLLSELAEILMDEERSEQLFNADSAEEFVQILQS